MKPNYSVKEQGAAVALVSRGDDVKLTIDGQKITLGFERVSTHVADLTLFGETQRVFTAQDGNKLFIHLDGKSHQVDIASAFGDGDEVGVGGGSIRAPMPGVVLEVYAALGQAVNAGDTLLLIESMKLQTEIKASVTGVVQKVDLEAGASFDKGQLLIAIEVHDADSDTEGED